MSLWLTMGQTEDVCVGKAFLRLERLAPAPEKAPNWMRAKVVHLYETGRGNGWISLTSPKRCSWAINFKETSDIGIWATYCGGVKILYRVRIVREATGESREIRFGIAG